MMKQLFLSVVFFCFVRTTTTTTSGHRESVVVVALTNETVTFDCDEHVDDHILWKKTLSPIVTGDDAVQHQNLKTFPFDENTQKMRHRRNKHSASGKLILMEVSYSDSGIYSCHSLKGDRVSLKSWTLIVLDVDKVSQSIFYQGVSLKNGTVITAQEGDSLSLVCLQILSSHLRHQVNEEMAKWSIMGSKPVDSSLKIHSWSKNSADDHLHKEISFESKLENNIHSNLSVATRSIVLDSLERSENPMNFECESMIDEKTPEKSLVKVDVVYPPTFTIRRIPAFGIPVVEGMRIALICEVDRKKSFGGSNPRWLKDEKAIESTNSSTLLFDRINSEDIGWYQCSINHEGETYSSIGYFLNVKPSSFDNDDFDEMPNDTNVYPFETSKETTKPFQENSEKSLVAGRVSYEERSPDEAQRSDCDGCCLGLRTGLRDLQEKLEYYQHGGGGPRISLTPNNENSVIICANPPPDKIFWITPTNRIVRPGNVTPDGFFASPMIVLNDTCVTASLTVESSSNAMQENNEVTVVAKNRYGMTEYVSKLSRPDPEVLISAEISSCDRPKFRTVLLLFPTFLSLLSSLSLLTF